MAGELHALLAAAGETSPYVLVGHSFGGFIIRVFNHEYPGEVAGMVLVDASDEDQLNHMPSLLRSAMYVEKAWEGAYRIASPLFLRSGVLRLTYPKLAGIPEGMFEELRYLDLQQKAVNSKAYQVELLFPEDTDEVRAAGNFGDKPLIVLRCGSKCVKPALKARECPLDFRPAIIV
jgi:pimeloyl-ACP methyl ester carboxylesterase